MFQLLFQFRNLADNIQAKFESVSGIQWKFAESQEILAYSNLECRDS